ncbi:MAG: pyruvate kinase [Candidatus Eisenbacteria bacterium]
MQRQTKIIATLGPASSSRTIIRSLIRAGVDGIRLNFSHGDHATHEALIRNIRGVVGSKGRPIPIIQDLQGPRFRVGRLTDGQIVLRRGTTVTLGAKVGEGTDIPVSPRYSFGGVRAGHRVTIGDLGTSLRVKSVAGGKLRCRVVKGGTVHSGKGISFPESRSDFPSLTEKDMRDLRFGISKGVDFIALSFVRAASDVINLRKKIRKKGVGIIAKIETSEAVREIDAIIESSDGILVARGDLASEVSISRLPIIQKLLIEKCNRMAKPVITATQMLESMMTNPQPTRAEASDVANAVLDGTDAVMLSGETAIGAFPVEAVRTMASIARRTEMAQRGEWIRVREPFVPGPGKDENIAYLAAGAAERLGATAIITSTITGSTALRVAKFRPDVPILAVTPSRDTRMKLALSHGVICEEIRQARNTDEMIRLAIAAARRRGIVKKGDLVVVTAGVPPWITGKTNLLKLEEV